MLTKKVIICTKTTSRVSVCCVSRGHSVYTSCVTANGSQASRRHPVLNSPRLPGGGGLKAGQGDPQGRQKKAPQPLPVSEPFSALGRLRLKGP